jgi:hypothetical protein
LEYANDEELGKTVFSELDEDKSLAAYMSQGSSTSQPDNVNPHPAHWGL